MIAKVGAATRHSQSAAPRAASWPLPAEPPAVSRRVAIMVADPRLSWSIFFVPAERGDIKMSALVVLVVAAPPDAGLVAPLGGAVEPLVHAPEAVQSACIGGIGVVDDAVLDHKPAHARPIARVRGSVGSAHGREPGDGLRDRCRAAAVPEPVARFAAMCGTDAPTYSRDRPGMSGFVIEDGVVYHTYSTYARGLDGLWGMYQWLDRAPKGRNETGVWWRRHDEYDKVAR